MRLTARLSHCACCAVGLLLVLVLVAHGAPLRPATLFESVELHSVHDGSHPHAPHLAAAPIEFDRTVHKVQVASSLFERDDASLMGLHVGILDERVSAHVGGLDRLARGAARTAPAVPRVYGVVDHVKRFDNGDVAIAGQAFADGDVQGACYADSL